LNLYYEIDAHHSHLRSTRATAQAGMKILASSMLFPSASHEPRRHGIGEKYSMHRQKGT